MAAEAGPHTLDPAERSRRAPWLPAWSVITAKRLAHIERVTTLLEAWASALALSASETTAWRDAGRWHDALRDASGPELRQLTGQADGPVEVLHGPAAAIRLAEDGEQRQPVLEAVRWHTIGSPDWDRTGRALFMADYLEPGRPFAREERAFLARHVAGDFDGVFTEVLRHRLAFSLREGNSLFPGTVELWNRCR